MLILDDFCRLAAPPHSPSMLIHLLGLLDKAEQMRPTKQEVSAFQQDSLKPTNCPLFICLILLVPSSYAINHIRVYKTNYSR